MKSTLRSTLLSLSLLPSLGHTGAASTPKLKNIPDLITCAAPLISHWVQESGYATEVRIQYGAFEFRRTDVGEPDGKLQVLRDQKQICDLKLSLSPDIHFSGRDQIMLIANHSGSNAWWKAYSLKDSDCKLVGETQTLAQFNTVKELLSESNGARTCLNK